MHFENNWQKALKKWTIPIISYKFWPKHENEIYLHSWKDHFKISKTSKFAFESL